MSDSLLRNLHRAATQSGSMDDWARYYQMAYRTGFVNTWQLEAASQFGMPAVDWYGGSYTPLCQITEEYCTHPSYKTGRANIPASVFQRTIRTRYHDLADVWAANIDSCVRNEDTDEILDHPKALGLMHESLVCGLEVLADQLRKWHWHHSLHSDYLHFVNSELRLLEGAYYPGSWPPTIASAPTTDTLTNQFGLGAPMGLIGNLMQATVAVIDYLTYDQGDHADLGREHDILYARRSFERMFEMFDNSIHLMKFCHTFGNRMSQWVLEV